MKGLWDLVHHQFRNCPHATCAQCDGRGALAGSPGWRTCETCGGRGLICPRTQATSAQAT